MADEKPVSEDTQKDAQYWQDEAKRAFKDRDAVRKQLRDLEQRALSDEDRALFDQLRAERTTAEEERRKKAGEFDAWRQEIVQKHDAELKAERTKRREKLVSLEFASAAQLFGDSGKTVLPAAIAEAYFGRHVDVVEDDQGHEHVVVKDAHGHVILDPRTGRPAPFAAALESVIETWPEKDRILRGSGKTGSGSPGGALSSGDSVDLTRLRPQDFKDPKVRQAVKARQSAAGGLQIGPAWDQAARTK